MAVFFCIILRPNILRPKVFTIPAWFVKHAFGMRPNVLRGFGEDASQRRAQATSACDTDEAVANGDKH
jgi:hypothetical protein